MKAIDSVHRSEERGVMNSGRNGLIILVILLVGVALAGALREPRTASAQNVATVSCSGGSVGLNDCTITLQNAIPGGGSFTATLTNPAASSIGYGTLPPGETCHVSPTRVTFACPIFGGCSAGSKYRDVVQLSAGSGASQSFSASLSAPAEAASPCLGPNGADLCGVAIGVTDCTGTDIFTGISNNCSGVESVDCLVNFETGASSTCSAASQSCMANTAGTSVNVCGVTAFPAGVQPFLIGRPVEGAAVATNPGCEQHFETPTAPFEIGVC